MIDSPSSHVVDRLKAHGDKLVGVGSALDFLAQDEDVVQDGELRERPVCVCGEISHDIERSGKRVCVRRGTDHSVVDVDQITVRWI